MKPRLRFIGLAMSLVLAACSGSGSDSDSTEEPAPPPEENTGTLSLDDASAAEDEGAVAFLVRADGSSSDEVLVDYATADVSATAGADYQAAAGTLSFAAGDTEQRIEVEILDDDEPEDDETFRLELTNPLNAAIARGTATATIVDDDTGGSCGAPEIDPAVDREAFLWKGCADGEWRVRVAGAGEATGYRGIVTAAAPFTDVTPVELEDGDLVDDAVADAISFDLEVTSDIDGFDFATADDGETCFDLTAPANAAVRVGPDRLERTPPFDLDALAACDTGPSDDTPAQLNVVVVFTDDQRFDTLDKMPNVAERLLPRGVEFENAYVPTPLCCPARASTYSGGFLAQNTGVLDNDPPNGGMQAYDDSTNIGTVLRSAGYRTAFVGKWLNDYVRHAPYVPPGWSRFLGRSVWPNQTAWTEFGYILGSSGQSSSTGTETSSDGQYHVDYERDRILEFLDQTPAGEPFLVFWSTTPPHAPMIPDERDQDAFADFTYRGRGYGEADLSDKPQWVRDASPELPEGDDEEVRDQLRSLLAVDRGLGAIIDAIGDRGEIDETVFIVTSDNGYMWGEHGLWEKNKPYEESLRVPLLVAMPGIAPRRDAHLVSAVLDLAPTLYDIAGVDAPSDGTSLVPLLEDPDVPWRDELFFQKYSNARALSGLWAGLRQGDWKYLEYWNDEAELYDLAADPFELENRADDPDYQEVRDRLSRRLAERVGVAIKPVFEDTDGQVDEPYVLALEAWGGKPPLEWTVERGALPPGLNLDPGTGEITGTPTSTGSWTFAVRLTSAEIATQAQRRKTFVSGDITIRIRS